MNHPGAAVGGMIGTSHQTARFEAVDGGGHLPAGQLDASAQVADRLWPFVKQRFENREIGQTHVERYDAALRVALEGPMGLHEHEPRINGWFVRWFCHSPASPPQPNLPGCLLTKCILTSYSLISIYIYRSAEWRPNRLRSAPCRSESTASPPHLIQTADRSARRNVSVT